MIARIWTAMLLAGSLRFWAQTGAGMALTLVFMVIYAYVPNVKLKLTKQFPGALFTAISWNLFSWGFSAYIERFNDFGVYGSLSTIIVVMMWLYFCMYLLLVGAHINRFAVPFRREILEK